MQINCTTGKIGLSNIFFRKVLESKLFVVYLHISTTEIMNMSKKTSLRARVLAMEVGESITIPVTEYGYTTIRSYASDLGFAANRKYSARRDRESRTYTIIRTA